jgi:hypothetical protein
VPVLSTMADQAADGCLVKPLFYQWVMDPTIPLDFTFRVQRPMPRKPDGWFHASQHPLATPRELWQWLARPAGGLPEVMDYKSLMSVMFGSLSHAVVERFLAYMGVTVPLPEGDCPACGRPYLRRRQTADYRYCEEHGASHPGTRARCHLDSILDFRDGVGRRGFDFKTIYPMGFNGSKAKEAIRDMDAAQFRERWPGYWAQMQECMRLTGLREYIVFFLTLGNPWDTREFHFSFDPEFAAKTEEKYRGVISCWERGVEVIA